MHRAYQPITPANNKLLKKRWDTKRFHCHRKKVDQAAPVIDNRPPKTYMHLHLKLKNLQIEEKRLAEIEKDNRILLEKMSYIMRTRGSVDNRNYYQQKSLNKTKRQRELLRLTHENQAILKRITAKEPHYHHAEWEDDWKAKQRYMDNISKYPKYWHKKVKQDLSPISPPTSSKAKRSSTSSERKRAGESTKEERENKGEVAAEEDKDNADDKEAKENENSAEAEKDAQEEPKKEAVQEDEKESAGEKEGGGDNEDGAENETKNADGEEGQVQVADTD